MTLDQLRLLQIKDDFCKKVIQRVMKDKTENKKGSYPYCIKEGILHKHATDNKQRFETRVVQQSCSQRLMQLAHDELGHNRSSRTYMLLRRNYFWKGMKPQVVKYEYLNKEIDTFSHEYPVEIPTMPLLFTLIIVTVGIIGRPSSELVSTAGTKAIDGDNVPNPSDRPCKRSKTE